MIPPRPKRKADISFIFFVLSDGMCLTTLLPLSTSLVTHTLTESAGFMDALVAGPAPPMRKKKKQGSNSKPGATTPPSPTITTPKLQVRSYQVH